MYIQYFQEQKNKLAKYSTYGLLPSLSLRVGFWGCFFSIMLISNFASTVEQNMLPCSLHSVLDTQVCLHTKILIYNKHWEKEYR